MNVAAKLVAISVVAVAAGAALALCSSTTGCAALTAAEPALVAAAPGIVSFVESELQRAQVPPSDPAYKAAIEAAKALEAEQTASQKAILAKEAAILKELRRQRAACPGPADAGSPVTVVALPQAPAVLPMADAGREGGS